MVRVGAPKPPRSDKELRLARVAERVQSVRLAAHAVARQTGRAAEFQTVRLNRKRPESSRINWEALGAVGEIVGAAGVIFSLLYLASQVRDNSRQLRHASAQAVLDKLNGLIGQLAFTEGAGDVWSRGLSGLGALRNDEEIVRFSSMLLQAFWAYEEVLHYRNAGLIEDWAWAHSKAPVEHFMRTPGFREWWALRREWFSSAFRTHVESNMPATTGALVEDFRRHAELTDQAPSAEASRPLRGSA